MVEQMGGLSVVDFEGFLLLGMRDEPQLQYS